MRWLNASIAQSKGGETYEQHSAGKDGHHRREPRLFPDHAVREAPQGRRREAQGGDGVRWCNFFCICLCWH